ncbi:MAG: hypothetical protein K6G26_10805 [Lachnospiraceae bacterium]|nr:hypothetical protein [Lachnospiraceae bacterium]
MAGLKCSNCGGSIRYHDTPSGIQYTVFTAKSWENITQAIYDPKNERMHNEWKIPEPYRYLSCTIWEDFPKEFREVWVCPHCGTIAVFDNSGVRVKAVYAPTTDIFSVDRHAEKYVVFSDYVWEEIAELSIPVSEISNKFNVTYYAIANEDYIWLFKLGYESDYDKVYKRISVAKE